MPHAAADALSRFEVLTLAVAGCSALFSLFLWLNARKSMKNQAFIRLLEQYSAPQMMYAVQSLHDLLERCRDKNIDLRRAFDAIKKRQAVACRKATPQEEVILTERSINNSRRVVTHFYYRLLSVLRTHVVPKRLVFGYWAAGGLQLIPDVIKKLELDEDKDLDDLYTMACRYKTKAGSNAPFWIILAFYFLISQGVIVYYTFLK